MSQRANDLGGSYRCRFVLASSSARMILGLGALLAVGACSAEAPDAKAKGAEAAARVAGKAAGPGYTVDVEVSSTATKGQESIAKVRIRPKNPWHMNLEYPAKLELSAPEDVALDTTLLQKGDAERFDDDELVFSVLFTPEAKGNRTIEGQVNFAVCGDDACGPVTESVKLAFEVGCKAEDTGLC